MYKKSLTTITALALTTTNYANAGKFFVGASVDITKQTYNFKRTEYGKDTLDKENKLPNLLESELTVALYDKNNAWGNLPHEIDTIIDHEIAAMLNSLQEIKGLNEIQNNNGELLVNNLNINDFNDLNSKFKSLMLEKIKGDANNIGSTSFITQDDMSHYIQSLTERLIYIMKEENSLNDFNIYNKSISEHVSANANSMIGAVDNNQTYQNYRDSSIKAFNLKAFISESKYYLSFSRRDYAEGSVSKTSPGISLMAGYRADVNNFSFITEVGVSQTFSDKLGEKSKQQIEVEQYASFFLTQKIGYEFVKNNLTYLNLGLSFLRYQISYQSLNKTGNLIQPIIGAGHEFKLNDNLSVFTEFNVLLSKKIDVEPQTYEVSERDKIFFDANYRRYKAGEIKVSSQQLKIGVRYYFG